MIVYKVVRRKNNGYFSATVPKHSRLHTKYVLKEPVSAPAGGFFCFKTLEPAQDFRSDLCSNDAVILICRARKDAIIPTPSLVCWPDDPTPAIRKFWRAQKTSKTDTLPPVFCDVPHGTILLTKITPFRVLGGGKGEQE